MDETALFDLLEEARNVCGRHAAKLADYLGAKLPNEETDARRFVEHAIASFTGRQVKLPAAEDDVRRSPDPSTDRTPPPRPALPLDPGYALEHGLCVVCGLPLAIGDWPCVTTIRPHGKSVQTDPFKTYYDVALGQEISSLGDRWQAMKPEGTQVFRTSDGRVAEAAGRGRLVYREKMSKGDLAARRDRIEQHKRERGAS